MKKCVREGVGRGCHSYWAVVRHPPLPQLLSPSIPRVAPPPPAHPPCICSLAGPYAVFSVPYVLQV